MGPVAYKTCDVCRKRKTKCIPASEEHEVDSNAPCTNCTRLGITCTYDHKYKKPGRPSSFAKAASEASGREIQNDGVVKGERVDHLRDTAAQSHHPRQGQDQGHEVSTDHGRVHGNGAIRSQSSGDMPHPSAMSLQNHDPGQPLRRLSEVALAPPDNFRMSNLEPRPPSSSLSAGLGNISHPTPFLSSPSIHPSAPIPFGPIPNSLAPPGLGLGPGPSSAFTPQLPHLDAFDFASAFPPYDEHEDGVENDLAIDWPTMSSGNGAAQMGTVRPDGSSGPPSGGVPGDAHITARGNDVGHPAGTLHSGFSPMSGTINTANINNVNGSSGRAQAPTLALQPPSSTASSIPRPRIRDSDRDFQIEDIVPWHTISFFITIYLGYSHSLFPMVHRPSFSQKLALRVDKRDKDFRALVLGIVAYTIGQSPLSRMTASFTRPELSALQHRCHRGSMMLLDRSFRDPNVLQVATLSAGYFYCQSVGKTTRALTLLSEACQLMHLLHMHDDDATAAMGLDAVEIQMRRRIWWHVYAVDITEASAGQMIHLNSFEGQPSFPSEIDDEYLTAQGSFPQPIAHTSYIVGLVACVRLFPVLEQVTQRSRMLRTRTRQRRYMTAAEIASEVEWIASANAEVDGIMRGLPEVLKMGWTVDEDMDEVRLAVMGMQRANMAITAVSIRFALADYRAELEPHSHSADADRASMGREAYHTLSIIPLDDLAANGESMRGKIFRILLALLKSNSDSPDWVATLQDWWTLFSRVQFVQLMTSNVESRLPSPEPGAAA